MREHPAMRDHPGVDVYAGQAARRHDSNVMFTLGAGKGPAAEAIAKRTGRRGVAGRLEPRSVERDPSRLCRIRPPRASQSARRETPPNGVTDARTTGQDAAPQRRAGRASLDVGLRRRNLGTAEHPPPRRLSASSRRPPNGYWISSRSWGSRKRTRPHPCPQGPDSESPDMAHGAASRRQSARPTLRACKPFGPRSTSN